MNKTKKYLIISAIVCGFIDLAWVIYGIVKYFMTDVKVRPAVFYVVLDFITVFECIAVAVLLILAIWKNGTLFRRRYGLYTTAIMISLIINLFSLSSILLIVSMFVSDWVWIKPKEERGTVVDITPSKEEKIASLRESLAKGEISQEEFDRELMNIL